MKRVVAVVALEVSVVAMAVMWLGVDSSHSNPKRAAVVVVVCNGAVYDGCDDSGVVAVNSTHCEALASRLSLLTQYMYA